MQNKPDISDVAAAVPSVQFIEEIGEGGFKVAYRGIVNGNEEAVKIVRIPVDPTDDSVEETNRRRLQRELDLLRKCQCPVLVKLGGLPPFDFQIGADVYVCYSEELIEGDHLRSKIQGGYGASQHELATLGACLVSAVTEMASFDTIHRDIKPLNIIATGNPGRPFVLLDLGIAFVVGGTNYTMDTQVIPGSRYYLAPEMMDVDFRHSIDYRADLYTIGLTLYEYGSGINPFMVVGDPLLTTMYKIKHQNPPPLSIHRGDLDKKFCALVDQLIRKLPALRPANLAQLEKRMEGFK